MLSFLKSIFGAGSDGEKARKLSHPRQLREGDFVRFQFLPQPEISGKTMEVLKVNTYQYDGIDYPELVLKGHDGDVIFMMIEEEDGEEYIGISKKVPKSLVGEIIDQQKLDLIFEPGTGVALNVINKPEGFQKWLAESYKETDEYKGQFSRGDLRTEGLRGSEKFKSYLLSDKSDEKAIEIEVYNTNEIEVSVTVYHDIDIIEEIYPGSLKE